MRQGMSQGELEPCGLDGLLRVVGQESKERTEGVEGVWRNGNLCSVRLQRPSP